MVQQSIQDLKYLFYGGGSDAEFTFLQSAAANGISALATLTPPNPFKPTGALYETVPRSEGLSDAAALSTGRLTLAAIWLPTATVVTKINFYSGATAADTPLNYFFALYSSALARLRQTPDATTGAWAANATKQLTLTTPFTTTYTGIHYLGISMVATTPVSLLGVALPAPIGAVVPIIATNADSSLTATAPATAVVSTAATLLPYAWVS